MSTTAPLLNLVELSDGEAVVIEAYRGIRLSFIPEGGGTVTYSFVDSRTAAAHDPGTSVSETTSTVLEVSWPFYRVSVAGGNARVALI